MIKHSEIILAIIAATFLSCDTSVEPQSPEEDFVRESFFRNQFAGHGTYLDPQDTLVYFIAFVTLDSSGNVVSEVDPPDSFLRRFEGNNRPVRKVSQCRYAAFQGVFDAQSGERGILFRCGVLRWLSSDHVEIDGGYFTGGIHAINQAGYRYTMEKVNGRWWLTRSTYRGPV